MNYILFVYICWKVYKILQGLWQDVNDIFPDSSQVHIGGDEVNTNCWLEDLGIQQWMKREVLICKYCFLRARFVAIQSGTVCNIHSGNIYQALYSNHSLQL